MNTISNRFSFSRFAAVLKCDLMENWMRYIGVFCILFFANLAYQLVDIKDVVELSMLRSIPVGEYMKQLAIDCVPLFYGVLSLSLMCAASDMTAVPFKSKGRAMNYLMMSATKLEKFLSRVFINVVMVLVMAYVALFLADLARMLYVAIFKIEGFYGFTLPRMWSGIGEILSACYRSGSENWDVVEGGIVRVVGTSPLSGSLAVVLFVLSIIYVHSLYLLGGCFWRKAAIVKTIFVMLVVILALGYGLYLFVEYSPVIIEKVGKLEIDLPFIDIDTLQHARVFWYTVGIVISLAFITLNWWLSFRFFSRKQMVASQHRFGGKHLHQLFLSRK